MPSTSFQVYVVPGSPRPRPDGWHGGRPRLRVAATPADGRANREVERVLSRLLGSPARLKSGASSRIKVIEVGLSPAEVGEALALAFGPG